MEIKTLIPIVTSVIALLAVILRELANRRNIKELEVLKGKVDLSKKYNEELLRAYIDYHLGSQQEEIIFLKEFVKEIQKIKDVVRDILNERDTRRPKATERELISYRKRIRLLYNSALADLQPQVKELVHTLKKRVEFLLNQTVLFIVEEDTEIKNFISTEIEELGKVQKELKVLRFNQIDKLLKNLGDFAQEKIEGK